MVGEGSTLRFGGNGFKGTFRIAIGMLISEKVVGVVVDYREGLDQKAEVFESRSLNAPNVVEGWERSSLRRHCARNTFARYMSHGFRPDWQWDCSVHERLQSKESVDVVVGSLVN